ncbi:MAG: sigma-70 family RNA polymerase sigma factor [Chitinophagaceae bacterium]|nr:sigma-70 family RNA polymerase sigma factor [Chitinophagaceae bacterium]
MKQSFDEKALLEGLLNHNPKAVEIIYKESFHSIQSLIINNNGSSDDAKDIFQEAIIVLYEKLRSGNLNLNCQIKTFLYSVSRRLWLKRLQVQNRQYTTGDSLEPVIQVDDELELQKQRDADFELMEKAFQSLGEPCKSLLEAFYIHQLNMQMIAKKFGYTNAESAKNQKYKCLVRLKKIFFENYKNGNRDE